MKKPSKKLWKKMSKKKLALSNRHARVSRVNGESHKSQLDILRAYYEDEIRRKESELAVLKAKLAHVGELAGDAAKLADPASEPNKYANMGPTEAILDAVGCLSAMRQCDERGVTPPQVRDYLLAHGFITDTSPNVFDITVNITLKRLAESGRIARVEALHRSFYRPRQARGRTLKRFRERERTSTMRPISAKPAP